MEKDGRVILELLQNKEYVTAEALADAMKLSIKTVRLRIKSLNETGRGTATAFRPNHGRDIICAWRIRKNGRVF